MRRFGHLLLLVLIATGGTALAGDKPAGRFTLGPSPEGFIRLDTKTGATAHCAWRNKQWVCERFIEEDDALRARVEALAAEVGRMHAAVEHLSAAVGRMAAPAPALEPEASSPPPASAPPGITERAVTRLMDMVRRLKQGLGATPLGA